MSALVTDEENELVVLLPDIDRRHEEEPPTSVFSESMVHWKERLSPTATYPP